MVDARRPDGGAPGDGTATPVIDLAVVAAVVGAFALFALAARGLERW